MQYFKMMSILAMLAMRVQAVPLSARQIAAPAVIEVVAATNGPFSGDGTYYTPGQGACGLTHAPGDAVVAINAPLWDAWLAVSPRPGDPNSNLLCGKTVNIVSKTGKVVNAKIVDRCAGCKPGDIDMDKSIFYQVDAAGDGRLKGVSWSIV